MHPYDPNTNPTNPMQPQGQPYPSTSPVQGVPPQHAATSKPRGRKTAAWIVGGVALVVALCCGGTTVLGLATDGDEQQPKANAAPEITIAATTAPATTAPATTAPATTAPATTEATKAPATKAPAKPTWKTVTTLKGSGNKRGQVFHLGDGQARLKYTIKGGSYATAYIYVADKGTNLMRDGGFPEVTAQSAGSDTTELVNGDGDYYIEVMAANCTWTITVQELR